MRRPVVPRIVPILIVALLAGCGASARTKVLRTSLVALNVARDTLRTTSKEREMQIVDQASSKEEGRAKLDAWRAIIDKVDAAIDDGYDAILAASILNDAPSASAAGAAVAKALALVRELKDPTAPAKNPSTKETP